MRPFILLLALALLIPAPALAKGYFLPSDPGYVGVQLLIPTFDTDLDVSSYTVYVTARHGIGEWAQVEFGLPYTHFGYGYGGGSSKGFGNVFLGVESKRFESNTAVDLGVWLPTASSNDADALFSGILADLNRWESFFPDVVSFQLGGSYWYTDPKGVGIRLRMSPTVLAPTEGGADTEAFLLYSGHVGYFGETGEIAGGVMGRYLLTEEGDFGERSGHQLEIAGNLKFQSGRFGLLFIVPLDENDVLDYTVGLQAGVAIK